MNAKAKRNKERKKLEATIVKTTSSEEPEVSMNQVFIYDKLNAHSVQAVVWNEEKNGLPYIVEDFELLVKKNDLVAHKRLGERLSGKLYQLTDEQLEATENYYGELVKRVVNENIVLFGEKK